ncbi:hypothetical protein NL676_039255 [Syzygium grande]|nr:hypothetical protein NL676_039255 [Syzygium grande]
MDFVTTTENEMDNCAIVLRPLRGGPTMPKSLESHDGFSIVGKGISAKSGYIVCEECAEEREKGEGPSAFRCCPCDPVVVGFRTKVGPIPCPLGSHRGPSDQVTVGLRTEAGPVSPPEKCNPSPSAAEKIGCTP